MSDLLGLARHHLATGAPDRALAVLADADEALLSFEEFWTLRAAAHLEREDWDEAATDAGRGLAIDAESVGLLSLVCEAEQQRGELASAESAVLAALAVASDEPHLLVQYAGVMARAGQLDKAEALADRATALDPDLSALLVVRADIAYLRGDQAALDRLTAELLAHDPGDPTAHHMRGVAMAAAGSWRRAARHYATAAGIDPRAHETAGLARTAEARRNPLLWPMWPIEQFGPWIVWGVGIGLIALLRSSGAATAAGIAGAVWLAYVVYTWTVPSMVARRAQ